MPNIVDDTQILLLHVIRNVSEINLLRASILCVFFVITWMGQNAPSVQTVHALQAAGK